MSFITQKVGKSDIGIAIEVTKVARQSLRKINTTKTARIAPITRVSIETLNERLTSSTLAATCSI